MRCSRKAEIKNNGIKIITSTIIYLWKVRLTIIYVMSEIIVFIVVSLCCVHFSFSCFGILFLMCVYLCGVFFFFVFFFLWLFCFLFCFVLVKISIITRHSLVHWVHKSNDKSDALQWLYKAWIKLHLISREIINSYDLSHSCSPSGCCIKTRELQMKDLNVTSVTYSYINGCLPHPALWQYL